MISIFTFNEGGGTKRLLTLSHEAPLIPRLALDTLKSAMNRKEIEVIVGPRQCGKTTLLIQILEHLQKEEGVRSEQIYYCNLDWLVDLSFLDSPLHFSELLFPTPNPQERIYLFIDEIQRLKEPGRILKGLYDLNLNLKMVVSGSSSLEIRAKLKEFLTGRKFEHHLYPISFKEWVLHHRSDFQGRVLAKYPQQGEASLIRLLQEDQKKYGPMLQELFWEFATFGGYPKVLRSPKGERWALLEEIYSSYVKKDVVEFMKIERPDLYNNLVKTLAFQIGNLINIAELGSLLGSQYLTLRKYLDILSQTYITYQLPPLVGNHRNEIKLAHKAYFVDTGLRNYVTGQLDPDANRLRGEILENTLFTELIKQMPPGTSLSFWRTKAGTEVDFIIDLGNKEFIPVEIKAGQARLGTLTKSFHSFIGEYRPSRAIFANQGTVGAYQAGDKSTVFYLPYHWIPLLDGLWQRS